MKRNPMLSRSKKPLVRGQSIWLKVKVVGFTEPEPAKPAVFDAAGVETSAATLAVPALVHVAPVHNKRVKGVTHPVLISVDPSLLEH